jgi:hypothetical protein
VPVSLDPVVCSLLVDFLVVFGVFGVVIVGVVVVVDLAVIAGCFTITTGPRSAASA